MRRTYSREIAGEEDTTVREMLIDMIGRADEKQLRAIWKFVTAIMRHA